MNCNFKYFSLNGLRSNQSGMTVIELIVAITIAVILMTGVFQFFIIQTRNFSEGRMIAEMQQELRWASNYITERLKLAGNGVPPTSGWSILENYDGGADYSDSVAVLGSFKSLVISTDQKMGNSGSQVMVTDASEVEEGDLIVISYPPNGWQEIFMVTGINPAENHLWHQQALPWNDDNDLDHAYPEGSTVTVVTHYSFFVEVTEEGRSNLMVQSQAFEPMILAGDIDDFQIRFKLKNGIWVDEPDELTDIRLVEITLRAMTPEPLKGYEDPVFGDAHKRIELTTVVIPKNIALVTD